MFRLLLLKILHQTPQIPGNRKTAILLSHNINKCSIRYSYIHSFILDISIAPLQVHYYSEALLRYACSRIYMARRQTNMLWFSGVYKRHEDVVNAKNGDHSFIAIRAYPTAK